AGGVGGLLLFNDSALGGSFPCYDSNGNVVKLLKATDSTATADYEYEPFGQVIRKTGAASDLNPFRFSSKHHDVETDLTYYGYRYYAANCGRWLTRDPGFERNDRNLYTFLSNDPENKSDFLGLCSLACGPDITEWLARKST